MIICIAEDRETFETPLKLLILSLSRHSPKLPVYLFFPPATSDFSQWLNAHPQVELCLHPLPNIQGWNVKPQAILRLFQLKYDNVIWIDSDIIVTRNISNLFEKTDARTLVITEEALGGLHRNSGNLRAELWGFKVGRNLPFALNTGVLRVTKLHEPVLNRWREILESKHYRQVQQLNWQDRPGHMLSDQDVLTALLASDEFTDVPLKILRRGSDIIQYYGLVGFTVSERIVNLARGAPMFVHAQGLKPWSPDNWNIHADNLMAYMEAVYRDLSPYSLIASHYRGNLSGDTSWMRPHFALSWALRKVGFSYPPLVGLPIAIVADVLRLLKGIISIATRAIAFASKR